MKTHFLLSTLAMAFLASCGGGQAAGPKLDTWLDPAPIDPGLDLGAEESIVPPADPGIDPTVDRDLPPPDLGPVDAPIQQGQPGWPCADNAECLSGWCIETPDGKACAATCLSGEACQAGYECVQVATVPDVQYACVHPAPRACRPCSAASDCESAVSPAKMDCVDLAGLDWCVVPCDTVACPAGTTCQEVASGRASRKVCLPEGGCACTALGEGVTGKCSKTNASGTCTGLWGCKEGQPGPCDAAEAQAEACNGLDDDCDGVPDDGLSGGDCEIKNAYGSCKGAHACVAGTELCQGSEPKPEVCNGIDENCDGKTDEGFSDMDLDGVADCVDPDRDGDGIPNDQDNCPDAPNADQLDHDQDGQGDVCDTDDDNDGVLDPFDNCPFVANPDQKDTDGNGVGDACDGDRDGDGIPNDADNCPDVPNADQADLDGDKLGDACDGDLDGDGILNASDNCVTVPNPGQEDLDKDGLGDACDPDLDGDTVANELDNCPSTYNPDQKDTDLDGLGYACDGDRDGDGVINDEDNCPGTFNPDQADTNTDGVGDACEDDWDGDGVPNLDDNCPWVPNAGQEDLDLDSEGDACDCDLDGDGVGNANPQCPEPQPADNCPRVPNPDQADLDQDGIGDACDPDVDGDGDPDVTDCAPTDPAVSHNAVETCNGVDDDCSGLTDEEGALGCKAYWRDEDLDAFGGGLPKCLCAVAGFFTAEAGGDCNDTDPAVNPAATETCGNGKDDNCNGSENEVDAIGCLRYYPDLDSDGYGTGEGRCLCAAIWDYSAKNPGDCDDLDPAMSPGLP